MKKGSELEEHVERAMEAYIDRFGKMSNEERIEEINKLSDVIPKQDEKDDDTVYKWIKVMVIPHYFIQGITDVERICVQVTAIYLSKLWGKQSEPNRWH